MKIPLFSASNLLFFCTGIVSTSFSRHPPSTRWSSSTINNPTSGHTNARANVTLPLPQKTIHQFPLMTWIENLAIRSNGDILTTHLGSNILYSTSPSHANSNNNSSNPIATIPNHTSLISITELTPDIFYISACNFSLTTGALDPNSFSIFSLDLTPSQYSQHSPPKPQVQKPTLITHLPTAGLLNGMLALPSQKTLLIADSYAGLILRLRIPTNTLEVALDIPETHAPTAGRPGVNGLKLFGNNLYFTNSALRSLYRVRFNVREGRVSQGSAVVKVAEDEVFMDDFAVADGHGHGRGVAFVTTNQGGLLKAVDLKGGAGGDLVSVAGRKGGLELAGLTACAFGRGKGDKHILYVVTNGGLSGGVDGGLLEGGKIVAVDTRGLRV